jgi:hypothetical protein
VFEGRRDDRFRTGRLVSGRVYELARMDRYEFVYVRGVGSGGRISLGGKNPETLRCRNFRFSVAYFGEGSASCSH